MKKQILSIICVLLLTNLSYFAQPMQDGPPFGPGREGIKKLLNLTPDQEKKFEDIQYQGKQEAIDTQSKIQKNRLELKKMLDDGNLDEKKFIQLSSDNTKLQGDLKNSVTKRWLDIYKMLNDDQKKIWTKHLEQMVNIQGMKQRIGERVQGRVRNFMMNRRMNQRPGMGRGL